MMVQTFTNRLSDIIIRPKSFFEEMELEGGYKEPLIFSFIVFFAVTIAGFILYLLGMPQMIVLVDLGKELGANELSLLLFLRTIAWAGGIFLMALMYHVGFKLVGGTGNYEATYRIVAYSSATYLFNVIPRVGIFIYCFYSLYLVIVGGSFIHNITGLKAVIAPLIPIVFLMALTAIAQSFG